jgi:K+-transporting ATPase ATPase A chain
VELLLVADPAETLLQAHQGQEVHVMIVVLTYVLVFSLALPLGWWMHQVFRGAAHPLDRLFDPIERVVYRALGVDPTEPMGWRRYGLAVLLSNLVLTVVVFGLLMAQGGLPLNPDGVPGMSWDLALHTAVSFVTNTNQQHYSGQAQISYLSHLLGLVTLQVVTPAVGLAVLVAILRGLTGGASGLGEDRLGDRDLGNHYADVTRGVVRVFLPLALVWSLALSSQGVPTTLRGAVSVAPLDASAGMVEQVIPLGPVAPMVAIKQLGSNGGGWYGPNSAVPLENPTPFSNLLQLVAILLVPVACVVLAGRLTERAFGWMAFTVMAGLSFALTAWVIVAESGTNPAFADLTAAGPNWEGKEIRFGIASSALWATLTTQTSNGSVNAMLDSLTPLGGIAPLIGMWVNAVFGGVGVGMINFLLFVFLTAFLSGLMVGRTPEVFQRKLTAAEIRLVAVAILVPPALVLVPAAITMAMVEAPGISAAGPHGLSQVIYEYSSAAANNGSGFEGLGDATVWWNVSCAVVLALGRYVPMLAPLGVAGLLAAKKPAPQGVGSLSVSSPAFGVTLLAVILIVQLLVFLPVLVLGPIAEHLVAAPAVAGLPVEVP